MDMLKFVVLDEEDLEVVSAHVQDAVVKASEVMWRPRERRLVVPLNRFDWEGAQGGQGGQGGQAEPGEFRRRRAALRFERVLSCKSRQIDGNDAVLNLLAVEFAETDAPAGAVTLTFSGGAAIRLEVECLEAELADLGPTWTAAACPRHAVVDGGPEAS